MSRSSELLRDHLGGLVQSGAQYLAEHPVLEVAALDFLRDFVSEEGEAASGNTAALLMGGALEGLSIRQIAAGTRQWQALYELAFWLSDPLGLVALEPFGKYDFVVRLEEEVVQ